MWVKEIGLVNVGDTEIGIKNDSEVLGFNNKGNGGAIFEVGNIREKKFGGDCGRELEI